MPQKLKKNSQIEPSVGTNFEDRVELFAMGIESCLCKLDRANYMQLRKRGGDDELRIISARTELDEHGADYFDGQVKYCFQVRDKRSGDDSLRLECTFQGHFHGPKTISRTEAERFLQRYFKIISWPYFRQFVSDMTARMSIPPLLLPLLPDGRKD